MIKHYWLSKIAYDKDLGELVCKCRWYKRLFYLFIGR